ncbi:MAG: prenyltransferase/squalene oxidase repeat-containing protein [Ignavibacteriota bacterium]
MIARQRPDGGWSQNPYLDSDAYATGENLFALVVSGHLQPGDEAFQRGVRYLLSTQEADGSWHVNSRSPKLQTLLRKRFPL